MSFRSLPNGKDVWEVLLVAPDGTNYSAQAGATGTTQNIQGTTASGAADSGNPVKVAGVYNTTMPTFTAGQIAQFQTDANGRQLVTNSPSGSANTALTISATTAAAGSLVAKASAGNLYGLNVVAGATGGYAMVFDATTVPADGTVQPKKVLPVAANAGFNISFNPPLRFATGIVVVFSTTGPFTKTISTTAFLEAEVV